MKVLLDTCVWGGAKVHPEQTGHDVVWVGDSPEDPGDDAVLARALAEGRVLVTLDKDFGELAVHRRMEHCGIVRLVGFRGPQQGPIAEAVLAAHGAVLGMGGIVTAEPGRTRIRGPVEPANREMP